MARFLKKSPLSILFLFFFLTAVLLRIFDLTISSTLNSKKSLLKHAIDRSLEMDSSFKKIDFSLISGIKFYNFSLSKDSQELVFVKELTIYPSFPKLLTRQIMADKIIADDCATSAQILKYKDFLLLKIENFMKLNKNENFSLHIRGLKVFLGNNKGFLKVNTDLIQHLENLTFKTVIDFASSEFNKSFLKKILLFKFSQKVSLNLQLAFMRHDLLVNNIVFATDNIKISGAGIVYDYLSSPNMDIKLITTPLNLRELLNLKSKIAVNGLLNIVSDIKGSLSSFKIQTEVLMAKSELYFPRNILKLSNVFCNFQFKNNELVIKELSALINYRFPVFLSGRIANFTDPEFNFIVESHKTSTVNPLTQQISDYILKADFRLKEDGITGPLSFSLNSVTSMPNYKDEDRVSMQFDNLRFPLFKTIFQQESESKAFDLASERLTVTRRKVINGAVKNKQDLKVSDFEAKFLVNHDSIVDAKVNCFGYNGFLEGRASWDLFGNGNNNYFVTKFTNLSIDDLKSVVPNQSDISGILSGWVNLSNYKKISLKGAAVIKEARISKLNLIDNIADFLGIHSLRELKGMLLFTSFAADDSGVSISRFNLHNDSVNLDAKLDMNSQGWVTGRVFLSLPKDILEESKILRVLLSMIKEKNEKIDFDFKVSGFANALRVELLEGEFRSKLMKKLSGGIRSRIEFEIDKAIKTFRENSQL